MDIYINDFLKEKLPNIRLGAVTYRVNNDKDSFYWLDNKLSEVCEDIKNSYLIDDIQQIVSIKELKDLYRELGIDPSRYRISSEALLRRVIQGKGIYRINQLIDFNNYISLINKIPVGTYDLEFLSKFIEFRIGEENETFESIAKRNLVLKNMPLFSDSIGPFGTMTSDSQKTKITNQTQNAILLMIFPNENDVEKRVRNCVNCLQQLNVKVDDKKII